MPTDAGTFRAKWEPSRSEVDLSRGSAHARGYNRRWAKASETYLKANPICVGCRAASMPTTASALTDHIIPARLAPDLFWIKANWQALCRWHHDVVKQRLEQMLRAGDLLPSDLAIDSPAAVALSRSLWQPGGAVDQAYIASHNDRTAPHKTCAVQRPDRVRRTIFDALQQRGGKNR